MPVRSYTDGELEKQADRGEFDEMVSDPDFDPIAICDAIDLINATYGIFKRLTLDTHFFVGMLRERPNFFTKNPHEIHSRAYKEWSKALEEMWARELQTKKQYGFIDSELQICFRYEIQHFRNSKDVSFYVLPYSDVDNIRKRWRDQGYVLKKGERKIAPLPPKKVNPLDPIREGFKKWVKDLKNKKRNEIFSRYSGVVGFVFERNTKATVQVYAIRISAYDAQMQRKKDSALALELKERGIHSWKFFIRIGGGKGYIRLTRELHTTHAKWDRTRIVEPSGEVPKVTVKIPFGEDPEELYASMLEWMLDSLPSPSDIVVSEKGIKHMEEHNRKLDEAKK